MNSRQTLRAGVIPAALAILVVVGSTMALPPQNNRPVVGNSDGELQLSPQPTTMDQIIHDKGNIVTTADNFGYIGGWQWFDRPSGEWPRNSGHDYLAEIRYWMGAVTPVGDTLLANTLDDFQGLPSPINGSDEYKILLSTDTGRYIQFDRSDTVGLGNDNPANGWRVWDGAQQAWIYNSTFDKLASEFSPGGPTSLQDSHYRFADDASGSPLLGLEMTQTIYQWNYCYNEDFLFVQIDITNTSNQDYVDFAFGLYIDLDVGGPDGSGENGRLNDKVAFDSLENLAWNYDVIGIDPGWGPTEPTGIMGTKLLQTPDDIGMTAFRTGLWALLPDDDPGRYALINSQQFDTSLPPEDQYYIQTVRGIDLTAGKTVRVVYALIAGQDEAEFRDNASRAQQLFDNNFLGPEPPPTPNLSVREGDGKVYLHWDKAAEEGTDPFTAENDFVGYKLYRSDNQGKTWGVEIHNTGNNCRTLDYVPLATHTVNAPGDPIAHSLVDTGLYNGVEYWYALVAFDRGDSATGVDPLQSGFGVAGASPNIIAVTPRTDPAGFFEAAGTVEHSFIGNGSPSEGELFPTVFDAGALTGSEYSVVFEDRATSTVWHLINQTTGDTVLLDQTRQAGDAQQYPVTEGLRVVIRNGDRLPRSVGQTAFSGTDTTFPFGTLYGPAIPEVFASVVAPQSDDLYRATYELRVTGDSSLASWIADGYFGTDFPYQVGFEAWNTTTNERISLAVHDLDNNDIFDPYDLLAIVDYPYDSIASVAPFAWPDRYGWLVDFDVPTYDPQVGDVFTIEGAPLNGPGDQFAFKVDGVNSAVAQSELKDVRVVPNPYVAQYSAMVETSEGQAVLEFQNLPTECTIRIYTLAGDLVQTLEHNDGTGTARWNLLTSNLQQVASGHYYFHIESQVGEHIGRFAVIK
ncbi:MAG: hypothetical protein ACE5FH_02220 [Candidatus Zixiibacteriota bacterium]